MSLPYASNSTTSLEPSGTPDFDGSDYVREHDHERLSGQLERIKNLVLDGVWRTLAEIEEATQAPAASVSAQLRHLRKPRFGSYRVEKRCRGDRKDGLYEYRVLPATDPPNSTDKPVQNRLPSLQEAAKKWVAAHGQEDERTALESLLDAAWAAYGQGPRPKPWQDDEDWAQG